MLGVLARIGGRVAVEAERAEVLEVDVGPALPRVLGAAAERAVADRLEPAEPAVLLLVDGLEDVRDVLEWSGIVFRLPSEPGGASGPHSTQWKQK